ncbi:MULTISPECIES: class I adenylate cyclase [unclassified Pseudodesulfovibrio]|uniref:class I adenylate cyclase n=1 Tax=unclassified Pseudodesulfovibrio TaxID=2661612 RepID=UPI000FEBC70F|nr:MULTISPECIES: class I adenylate cyclase [unclassified Pseudodesulfovibrio]MCJ2165901.1 class I adenylate cyclase [Pseudodesulfovibrio sp. S3-i]RWU02666.1 adenylate cyclase [Pseudodesulfovibrio sp. S3]
MGEKQSNIGIISKALDHCINDPGMTDGAGIGDLAIEFMQWCDATPSPGQVDATALTEVVLTFYRIAGNSNDIQTMQSCLQALVRSGRFGRALCSRFVSGKTMPIPQLAAKVASWPAQDRLALAHEMLLNYPGNNDKEILNWLENLLKPLMGTDPAELAPFVARLGEQGITLAFPVRQIIVGGLFGRWINARLTNGTSGPELEQLCRIIRGIGDANYAEALAKAVELNQIVPNVTVLRTITALGEAGNKTIMGMLLKTLSNAANGLAGACLEAIIAQDHPGAGKLLASVRGKMPGLKNAAISRAPLLGDIGHMQYIASFPEDAQLDIHMEMLGVLEAIAPDFTRNITRQCLSKQAASLSHATTAIKSRPKKENTDDPAQSGFFKRLFKSRPKSLEELLPKFNNLRDMKLPSSRVEDTEMDGRELTGLTLTGSEFTRTTFTRTKVAGTSLDDTVFSLCLLTSSEFKNTDFTGTEFSRTTFAGCSFNDCSFKGTVFTDCTFEECRFRNCGMGDTAFLNTKLDMTDVAACTLAGSSFHRCSLRATRFGTTDFTYTELIGNDFQGVEFIDSILHAMYIRECNFTSIDMPGTTVTRSIIKNSDAGHPQFLANRIRQMTLFAREVEKNGIPKTKETDPFLTQKALNAWSRELTFMRRERRMLENNRQRLNRAMNTISRDQQVFLRILPLLLDTDTFERKFNFGQVPTCRVWEYYPELTTLELARQHFGDFPARNTAPDVRILAVYSMGSLGTVAQTAKSDLDCWVCYDSDITLTMEADLKRKLDAIALWAESEFAMEVHFYPMRMDDVRDNRFLSGDEESSGSAQALLLKEEFYRTALKLAGKNIAWWVTPAGASCKIYDACISASRRYPICGKPRLEDFGYLAPVPPSEYFGGSLWQMVKAVHSPFKSVLKLGLLEIYASPHTSTLPLCDRIKRNLTRNRQGKLNTDPYTALFSILHAYYQERNETNASALLKESFRLKANLSDIPFFMNLTTRPEDESLISVLFGSGYVEPDRIARINRSWPFEKSLRMGALVRQYMVDTYQRIQEGLNEKGKTKAMINAEDLTRMGRRIGANFAKKKHKIMRVPFMDIKDTGFPILHFSAERKPGSPPIWAVRGGTAVEAKQSADALQLLHRNPDPVHMMAWLLANRIYQPRSLLQADRSIAPIAVADLQKVMTSLHEFFPFAQTFERDINEGLHSERVTSAFFIFNLTAPPDSKRIEQAAVLYTTNWGEMFCRTFLRPGQILERSPSQFLAHKLDQPVPDPPKMSLFVPKGSQCKRFPLV